MLARDVATPEVRVMSPGESLAEPMLALFLLDAARIRAVLQIFSVKTRSGSALTRLETLLRLVDHIYPAFTAHDLTIAMARLQRAQ